MKRHKEWPDPPLSPFERADKILEEIRTLQGGIEFIRETIEREINEVRNRHQKSLDLLLEELAINENAIMELMKKERAEIFDGRERTELKHGILLYLKEFKLSISRKATEKIIAQGWPLRIAISINKRAIEFWPDEWLRDMGIVRKPVENFSYEITQRRENEDS